jgi:hypothetical protein
MNPRYTIYIEDVDLDADIVYDHTEQRYLRVEEYADLLNRLDAENGRQREALNGFVVVCENIKYDLTGQGRTFVDAALEDYYAALSPAAAPVAG